MGSGYPTTSYGNGYGNGYSSGYASKPSYYSQPIYQSRPTYYSAPQPVVMIQTRYVPVAVPTSAPRPSRMRDCDRDGVPDRYQRRRQQHYEAAIALAATALVLASTACMQPPDMSAASYGTAPEPYRLWPVAPALYQPPPLGATLPSQPVPMPVSSRDPPTRRRCATCRRHPSRRRR